MKEKTETITGLNASPLGVEGRWLIFFSILFGLGVTIFGKSLYELGAAVLQRYGSSHGIFVPFISGYLVWLKHNKIRRIKPKNALIPGCVMATAGVLLFILGHVSEGIAMQVLSFLLIAAGFILVLFGREVFKEVCFPLFFLAAMIPLPTALYNQIAEWMRQATTWGAVTLLKPIGIHLYRDGFHIYLPNAHLFVDHSCSGIRYLLSYLVFAIAYAFCYKQSTKARTLVVLAALPLSVVGGVLRLGIIFFSAYTIGPIMAEHRPHVFLSWSVFTALLVGAIGMDRYVSRIRAKKLA